MTALLAASRQDSAATLGLHAHAKAVSFGAAALPRLICTLWQSNPPCVAIQPAKTPTNIPGQPMAVRSLPLPDGFGVFTVEPAAASTAAIGIN
jgi:hypothetical protein